MFSNAGVVEKGGEVSILDSNYDNLRNVFDANVLGAFLCAKHAARVMIPARKGSVVFTSSVASVTHGDVPHEYTASKHTVVGIDEKEKVEEYMCEIANLKEAQLGAKDVAEAALYLASDESKVQTSHSLIDGSTLSPPLVFSDGPTSIVALRDLATIAMTTEETSKNNKRPQVVKLDRALKLAEQWVTNMGKSSDDDKPNGAILESRPPRLGIGAIVPRESKHVRSNDPIERKLRATLNAKERKAERRADERAISANDKRVDEDSDDDESESKTKSFSKKRPAVFPSPLNPKKKHK
nr:secoisolariciresinol dehydrogenase-like [Ipomoea batatas]